MPLRRAFPLFKAFKLTFVRPMLVSNPGAMLSPFSRGKGISPWRDTSSLTPASSVRAPMYSFCWILRCSTRPRINRITIVKVRLLGGLDWWWGRVSEGGREGGMERAGRKWGRGREGGKEGGGRDSESRKEGRVGGTEREDGWGMD